ncbi:DMT family transporter [Hoeflea poritis]|uniref:DMT family transporter n=1 Tax=Hoeflea poritis TaxID=2993659 RepID=A0ABT4VP25_9HYPH|nr:DMT family transporter [Hoeflea poritis]MDA4846436.1 DMT family transporter [Hoeflea poritis]
MHNSKHPGWTDYGMLCMLAVIWGGSFMLTRIAVADVPPITLTAIRQVVAVIILAAVAVHSGQRLNASRSDHAVIVASAFFGLALPFVLISWGLQEITAGLSAILMGLMPLITIILAHFFTHDEKMNQAKLVGVFLGIGGLVVLFWPDIVARTDADIWRQLAIMGAGVSYAINALITKRLLHLKPRPMFAVNIGWSVVMLAPAALLFEPLPAANPPAAAWFSILLLGIFPTALASLLMFRIIGRQGASFFGQINLLVPVAGVIWGALILGERLSFNAFIALAIILSGVAVARFHPKPKLQTIEEKTS